MADKTAIRSKKTKHSRTSWSELPIDPFELILSKLSPGSILRLEVVCRPWLKAIKYISRSSPSFTCLPEPPLLLAFQDEGKDGVGFYSLEGKFYNMPKQLCDGDSICIGSSHGWLLFLSNKKQLLLLNPVSAGIQLLLPPLDTFLYSIDPVIVLQKSGRHWRQRMLKVAVSLQPTCGNKKSIGVLLMYNYHGSIDGCNCLAFCTPADNKWTKLAGQKAYVDVTSDHNGFYALNVDYSVEVWDFTNSLIPIKKKLEIIPAGAPLELKLNNWFPKPCIAKTGASDLFLVQRISSLPILPVPFIVYKLEYNNRDGTCTSGWTKVESFGNQALVLGSNQSIFVTPQEFDHENSIYFTYAPSYDTCFLCVYNLRRKNIKRVSDDLGLTGLEKQVYWLEPRLFSTVAS
ncbi:PREDICTED: probable F-box protein At4g22165 [Prunus mume]|uniref:Probable F-box protein At4g22165 n=1 Tax=Prunus mume TaxID=102107 RepID=A0ABM0NFN9_PRUMU|nr:PREDICTED: probable F-box protein At4g22165 [Prunus mume]